jgi:outer membrane protein assembly factor BamB
MLTNVSEQKYLTLRQSARGIGFVALVFSLTVATLLATDWMRTDVTETVRSDVLAQALAKGRTTAHDEQTVAFARQMDLLARRAYFSGFTFRQSGMLLLVLGLLVTAGCFGVAWRLSLLIPDPRGLSDSDPASTDRRTILLILLSSTLLLFVAAGMEWRQSRHKPSKEESDLRARLKNPLLKPGEENVCPCKKGTSQQEMDKQWPFFRGSHMNGVALTATPPQAWDVAAGKNITWKQPLAFKGSSSPAVWGNRLFLTTGDKDARRVLAYDTETGKPLWDVSIADGETQGAALPEPFEDAGFAAASPACDEKHVYAIFGTGDLVALNHEGKKVWQVYLGRPDNSFGHVSSLVYCGQMLLVQWDHQKNAKIVALDKQTGKILWETPRTEVGMSWSTPLVMMNCDKPQLIVNASKQTWGLEMATGKKLWMVNAVEGEIAPSLTSEGDTWVAANEASQLIAFKMQPEGAPKQLWSWNEGGLPDVSSPVAFNQLVFFSNDKGDVVCHSRVDGKRLWAKQSNNGFYMSPIVAGGKLFVADREQGIFRIYTADQEGKELATLPMGEAVNATPAFVGKRIYIRSKSTLWCIEDNKARWSDSGNHSTNVESEAVITQ